MARILVIDDEDAIRALLREALTQQGHQVREAKSGADGVRVYQKWPADLVVTDMFMPESGGLGCILELRKLNPRVRIIAITGGGPSEDLLEMASHFGADCTFSKPLQLADVLTAIQEQLKTRRTA